MAAINNTFNTCEALGRATDIYMANNTSTYCYFEKMRLYKSPLVVNKKNYGDKSFIVQKSILVIV